VVGEVGAETGVREDLGQPAVVDLLSRGFRYAEVPISYAFRRHGRSFVRLGPYLRRVVPGVRTTLRDAATRISWDEQRMLALGTDRCME
jgi:hypothetical protein